MDALLWVVAVVVACLFAYLLITLTSVRNKIVYVAGRACSAVLVLTVVFSPEYYEFPSWPSRLYQVDPVSGVAVEQHWGTFEYGKTLAMLPKESASFRRYSSITPITENPKVQRIRYLVRGKIVDVNVFLSHPKNRFRTSSSHGDEWGEYEVTSATGKVLQIIGSCQYEFNYVHSAVLASFYNPLDEVQQEAFKAFVEPKLNACLIGDGIKVSVERFFVSA